MRVVVDADVLGRHRTGDETYVRNLLRELAPRAASAGLSIAAVTRNPGLVPAGIEPVALPARSQELRMAWSLPRRLHELDAVLLHTQYAVPWRAPCPAVVTIHDLSFERDRASMGWRRRFAFRRAVPRAVRTAVRVLTVSERSKRDLVELYGVEPGRVVVTPNGVDPAFTPGEARVRGPGAYVLTVGAVQSRKNQLAALRGARLAGLPLVVVGPVRDERIATRLRSEGATLSGYVELGELVDLYRGAACVVQSSTYEGFGLPVLEAMACGTPVVTVPDEALVEVAGGAAIVVPEPDLADGIRRALAERDRLVAAGLERAQAFTWGATAQRTLDVYLEVLER